ncbi:snoRNA-binding rRNA-processing protein utp10 [Tulasnella sp. UAMH 9824]|nr:snoRNA-binding rRNA-processing protein utp10 [Tulasnella sp. UAMH 9824]
MVSSLAAQLAQGASLNSAFLLSATKHRHYGHSYLFEPNEAANHDLASVYAIGQNGFMALCSLDSELEPLGIDLFSPASRNVDRTTLPPEQHQALRANIAAFMRRLSQYILDAPAAKALEWLVRRFRVNEFDVDLVLECFLPFHESPQFAKMHSILTIKADSMWSFLKPSPKIVHGLPRSALLTQMTKERDFARFVLKILSQAVASSTVHRTLVNFHTSVAIEYISRLPVADAGILAFFLPSITGPMSNDGASREITLSAFVVLAALAQSVRLSSKALKAIIQSIVDVSERVSTLELLTVLIALFGSREEAVKLPKDLYAVLKDSQDIVEVIPKTLAWRGADRFYIAFMTRVLEKPERGAQWSEVTSAILDNQSTPLHIVKHAAKLAFESLESSSESLEATDFLSGILFGVNQRKPQAFRAAALEHSAGMEDDEKAKFDKLVADIALGLSVTGIQGRSLAISSDDVQARLSGLRELLENIEAEDGDATVPEEVRAKIMACLRDNDEAVLGLAYSKSSLLLQSIPREDLLSAILSAASASSASRHIISLHHTFLADGFAKRYPEERLKIFQEAFVPNLLFTKSRAKQASTAWSHLLGTEGNGAMGDLGILSGCSELLQPNLDASAMAEMNLKLSNKLAENAIYLEKTESHRDFFLAKLTDSDPYLRSFAFLVVRAFLERAGGDLQLEFAFRVVESLGLTDLEGFSSVLKDARSLGEFIQYESIAGSIVSKASSSSTLRRLQASVIALLPGISRPNGVQLEWLKHNSEGKPEVHLYVKLTRAIYSLANSCSSLHSLPTNLLRALFLGLKDEALLFLAGVWTEDLSKTSSSQEHLRRVALSHAAAFLRAQASAGGSDFVDFQVVVPALLVALGLPDKQSRQSAIECLKRLVDMQREQRASLYASESIYGERSGDVQILSMADCNKYLKALTEKGDSFVADAEYLPVFHREYFSSPKQSQHKQRIICFLLSHSVAWRDFSSTLQLLSSVRAVSEPAKLPFVLSLIEEVLSSKFPEALTAVEERRRGEYFSVLLSSFDKVSASILNTQASQEWTIFKRLMDCCADAGVQDYVRVLPMEQLRTNLFRFLSQERKVEVTCQLLHLLTLDIPNNDYGRIKQTLSSLLSEVEAVVGLLPVLAESLSPEGPERTAKRSRMEESNPGSELAEPLQRIRLVAEALASSNLPPEPEVISCIFGALRALCDIRDSATSSVEYILQMILTALDKAVGTGVAGPIPPGVMRIDVLIDLIRASGNPQLFQQALLIISNIARIDPESVIQSVMPIFTFMGSNVFHRDDSFSFRVVQKTIEGIVPVMVKTLKKQHDTRLDLLVGSRDFLRIFSDAAIHVPRHRRTFFFTHLVDVLGPRAFLAPMVMLLVEKSANRVVRQAEDDVSQTLSLPLAMFARHPHELRLDALVEILEECQRLGRKIDDPINSDVTSFLQLSLDDHSPSPSVATKKQIVALVVFVGFGIHAFGDHPRYKPQASGTNTRIQQLLTLLVQVANLNSETMPHASEEIGKEARRSLLKALTVIPAADFVQSVAALLRVEDAKAGQSVQAGAIDLFAERLPLIASGTRAAISSTVLEVLQRLKSIVSSRTGPPISIALRAINAIAVTMEESEGSLVTSMLEVILQESGHAEARQDAITVLTSLTSKLGPRLLPYVSSLVSVGIECAHDVSQGEELHHLALLLLLRVVENVPAFLGQDLSRVVTCCLGLVAKGDVDAPEILSVITSKVPARSILSVIRDVWASTYQDLNDHASDILQYFHFCKAGLSVASRTDIAEQLKELFKFFLDVLDIRSRATLTNVEEVETAAIEAFLELVTKLNEATFKPFFRRLFDWAFSPTGNESRQVTFSIAMTALLDMFKNLIVPYMSMTLESVTEALQRFISGQCGNHILWTALIRMLQSSLNVDEGLFWRDDRLERIAEALAKQISACARMRIDDGKILLPSCMAAFAHTINREELLKSFHFYILMETRSEEPRAQLLALQSLTSVWRRNGSRVIGFATESLSFIEDLAESDNDNVAKEARVFKKMMDKMSGNDTQDTP